VPELNEPHLRGDFHPWY